MAKLISAYKLEDGRIFEDREEANKVELALKIQNWIEQKYSEAESFLPINSILSDRAISPDDLGKWIADNSNDIQSLLRGY